MASSKSFEEQVLAARAQERDRYGKAIAAERGPIAYSKSLTEEEQDRQWEYVDPKWRDPAAAMQLTAPKEMGGFGLTPLAASYVRRPYRKRLVDGAGPGIEAQIKYAELRQRRVRERPLRMPAMMGGQGDATQVPGAPADGTGRGTGTVAPAAGAPGAPMMMGQETMP